jgi:hypothetical protein
MRTDRGCDSGVLGEAVAFNRGLSYGRVDQGYGILWQAIGHGLNSGSCQLQFFRLPHAIEVTG